MEETSNNMQPLMQFCNAEFEIRKLKTAPELREQRNAKTHNMQELMRAMEAHGTTCVGLDDTYVRIAKAYNTRDLTPSLIRCSLHEHFTTLLAAPAKQEEELTRVILDIIRISRTAVKPVVTLTARKPRNIPVMENVPPALNAAVQQFKQAKLHYDQTASANKLAREELQTKREEALPAVEQYMLKRDNKSQAILLSKNDNQKMFLRQKQLTQKPPVPVSLLRDVTLRVLENFRETHGSLEADVLSEHKEELIENIISTLVTERPVFTKQVLRLDRTRQSIGSAE